MALMMASPILFMFLLPDPYYTVAVLGTNMAMLLYLRKTFKNVAGNLFGHSKLKYQCLTCQGTKFDKLGSCFRCGSKAKRAI
jgi:hypothetical protein